VIRADIRTTVGTFDLVIELEVNREITVLYGHSGAGKSLTLEAIAGLLKPRDGYIELDGRVVFDRAARVNLPPHRRNIGYVVQDYALFPHLTVGQNIAYGVPDLPRAQRRDRIDQFARMLDLEGLLDRRPSRISGGQAQRVALARALVRQPQVLLLDEPFAAVDSSIRRTLRRELRRLAQDLNLSVVMVTHDLMEAYNVGDRIAVIDDGHLLQVGPKGEVFHRPTTRRAAELLGVANIFKARVVGNEGDRVVVATDFGCVTSVSEPRPAGEGVYMAIPAEQIFLERPDRSSPRRENQFDVTIVEQAAFGFSHTLTVQIDSALPNAPELEIDIAAHPYQVLGVASHRRWAIHIPPEAVHLIDS
jgi:molybdate transport system ATP-binding protein